MLEKLVGDCSRFKSGIGEVSHSLSAEATSRRFFAFRLYGLLGCIEVGNNLDYLFHV